MSKSHLCVFLAFLGLWGCGMLEKVGLETTANIVHKGSGEVLTERNWQLFAQSLPANMKFVEGLVYVDPSNEHLLSAAIKSYSGYAFGVNETLYLADRFAGKWKSEHLDQAVLNYSKAVDYGLSYLELKGIGYERLRDKVKSDPAVLDFLDRYLSPEDVDAVFFTANAWGNLINLQKKNLLLVAQLPLVKTLFDWVCTTRPDLYQGSCNLFYAVYQASRPKMLGGNPQKGKELFLKGIEKYPHNFLIRVAYIQYYLIPLMDLNNYKDQKIALNAAFLQWDKESRWSLYN